MAFAPAERAGTIASSTGNPIAMPRPRRNVRRGSATLVMITVRLPVLERQAVHDADHDGGEAIVVRASVARDSADGSSVIELQTSAQGVRQEFLGVCCDELIGAAQQRLAQTRSTFEPRAVGQRAGRVDRTEGIV